MSDFAKSAMIILSGFTEEEPLMVPPHLYARLLCEPDLADLMGRVRIQQSIPLNPSNEPP